jgi:hypothetical protein
MTTMGLYEVRAHLSELVDQVAKAEESPYHATAALLGPPPKEGRQDVRQVVEEMLAIRDREGPTLGGQLAIRKLIDEGCCF